MTTTTALSEDVTVFLEQVLATRSDVLTAAPLLVVFQRYRPTADRQGVYQLMAVTAIGIDGRFAFHTVTSGSLGAISSLMLRIVALRIAKGDSSRGCITGWGDLTPRMRQRILVSAILPREMRTMQRMDRLTVETEGDFFLVMAGGDIMRMLS